MATNLTAVWALAREAARVMIPARRGRITGLTTALLPAGTLLGALSGVTWGFTVMGLRWIGSRDPEATLNEIPGIVPALNELPAGCAFAPRCEFATDVCRSGQMALKETAPGHSSACVRVQAKEIQL